MKLEARVLYIVIIIMLVIFNLYIENIAYNKGFSEGKLQCIESFKNVYMPAEPETILPGE